MDNKTISIVSYITIIGWLIAYFSGKDTADDLAKYHLRQSLGAIIVSFLFSVVLNILLMISPIFGILGIVGIFFLVIMIIGIINASNELKKPLPVIGKFFEDKFAFLG